MHKKYGLYILDEEQSMENNDSLQICPNCTPKFVYLTGFSGTFKSKFLFIIH